MKNKIKKIISDCCNDVLFIYNGKKSGITSTVKNSIPTFQVWYGEKTKEYNDIDSVMSDNFFDGKSLNDLSETVNFSFA